jgi:hypothetical protein
MDPVAFSVGLANRRVRPPNVAGTVAPLSALTRNPVELVVVDEAGEHSIAAERGKNGKVWLTCQCAASVEEGWCDHRLNLICGRFDQTRDVSAETRKALGLIVNGTSLHTAGLDADRALKAFEECLVVFDARRPAQAVGRNLGNFTDLISDLAACASELEDALSTLRRLLERS